MIDLIYSLLFAVAALSALLVVFSRHSVHSALFLVVTMVSIAGIFILINAQFAAALQVLVYAGAIMVLFVFVIMLLNLGRSEEAPISTRGVRRAGLLFFAVFVIQSVALVARFAPDFRGQAGGGRMIPMGEIALALLTKYLYAFEATSVMLLIAVVGAMVLARRRLGLDIQD